MAKVNVVVLSGRSCSDVDVRDTKNSKVATIRLAHNESEKRGDKWIDHTTFVDCDCWGKKAEYAAEKVSKGTSLIVEGRLKMDEWEKDGQKQQKMKIVVSNINVDHQSSGESREANAKPAPVNTGGDSLPF